MASTWRVNNATALGGEVCSPWQANHAYSLGARCICTVAYATTAARKYVYEVTSAGTSHASTQPTWPTTPGNTVVDNGVTWTCRSPSDGSWDNATASLLYLMDNASGCPAAGDTVYVHDAHSEALSWGSEIKYLYGSTNAALPIYIYCVDKTDDSLSVGAVVECNYRWYLSGFTYSYGVEYSFNGDRAIYGGSAHFRCVLESDGTTNVIRLRYNGTAVYIAAGGYQYDMLLHVKNANIRIDNAASLLYIASPAFVWEKGSLVAANGVTQLISATAYSGSASNFVIRDVDLSAVGASGALVKRDAGYISTFNGLFERCKLHASTALFLNSWSNPYFGSCRLHQCSSANAVYDFYESHYYGDTSDETTVIMTDGASDGTTGHSVKMVSSANAIWPFGWVESIPIFAWTDSTSSTTFTVEGIVDSATNLQDDEIWLELDYPVNDTDPLGSRATSKCAILGTAADVATSTATWTTTGLSNPNEFKLSVTVAPGKAGPITARVFLAKASTTVYINPQITES